MACLEMYNNPPPPNPPQSSSSMSPRISFSNDFVESHNSQHLILNSRTESPVSSDFEFSVSNHNMLSADELLFKGRLLPFKDHNFGSNNNPVPRTLRDELLNDDDDDDDNLAKPPKATSSPRWKGFLGLKKTQVESKKLVKTSTMFAFHPQNGHLSKSPQEMENSEEPGSSDMEIRI